MFGVERAPESPPDAVEGDPGAARLHEVRLAGRGGQGVVTAGDLLGKAAVDADLWAQSIPTFGPERRGALALATLRMGPSEILLKCTAARPSVVLVLDATIWHHVNVLGGIREDASLIFNTARSAEEVGEALATARYGYRPVAGRYSVFAVDATGIALDLLGKPITNTAMIGAFVAATGLLAMRSVEAVLRERFGEKARTNVDAARTAHDRVRKLGG